MNTNKEYKSSLVVWNDDELPVIETFYADSVDEIRCLQEKWMNDHDYESANMHLHHQIHGQWHSIQQCEFRRMPKFPEFAFLHCSPHESDDMKHLMSFTIIQIETGRILRAIPKDRQTADKSQDGIVNSQITYLDEKGRKVEFSVAVIKMSDEDMEMMEDGDTKALAEMLGEDLFLPFAKWFTQYQNSKHKQ